MFLCPICSNKHLHVSIKGYVECRTCKILIVKKIPNSHVIQKFIEKQSGNIIAEQRSSLINRDYIERLHRLEHYIKPGAKILDYGCGSGLFLQFLASRGYKPYGYDKSKRLTTYLRDIDISCYTDMRQIPNGYFDAITVFDVIEHNNNASLFIRDIKRKVKKGGVLMITTPNAFGVSGKLLRSRWWVFNPKGHYVLFSPASLKNLLHKEGFKILHTTTDTITPWFMPVHTLVNKVANKIVYRCLLLFKKALFQRYLGDNIEVIAISM
jgi:2-polyprenyl-3-methyl-5-hydroxy-6-metoxy-1,4-benzoquinol methylase